MWSEEARAMVRPFRTYDALAGADADVRALAAKIALLLLSIGAFVSFTSAGRLVAAHVALAAIFWAFVPFWQIVGVALALRVVAPRVRLVPALTLYFVGHGPWLAFIALVSAVCLFAPNVYGAMMRLLATGVLPGALAVAAVWGVVLTVAFFRRGLGLGRARTAVATFVFYVTYVGAIAGYYFATDQILPNFFFRPAP
jgi:hypothetical protein